MSGEKEWVDTARLRQGLYRFFGAAYLPPNGERIEDLARAAAYLDTIGVDQFAFAPWWFAFLNELKELPTSEELNSEYVRLFHASSQGTLCPPLESFYKAAAEGGGMANLLSALDREYRALGIQFRQESVESVDHVSVEMETMAELCAREAEAAEQGDADEVHSLLHHQLKFLTEHVGSWFPSFAARVNDAGAVPFYARLTDAAEGFILHERDFIPGLSQHSVAADRS